MTGTQLLPVTEAQARVIAAAVGRGAERVPLDAGHGRILAGPVIARRPQPPLAVSAMDGYAVRSTDVVTAPVTLRIVARTPAGAEAAAQIHAGEAVRIFTGAPLPSGADTIIIQENTRPLGDDVEILVAAEPGRFVRPAGLDFATGDTLIPAGVRLTARHTGLAAAAGVPSLSVRQRPRVGLFATGDELVLPGEEPGPAQIFASNSAALAALVRFHGGEPADLGIVRDTMEDLESMARSARDRFDIVVCTGGASVGDHDLVQEALSRHGLVVDFWRIAMRPGKPLMFGTLGSSLFLGLPGNPVSALVCALLFLVPALRRMLGIAPEIPETELAIVETDLPANDHRQDYVRAAITGNRDSLPVVRPVSRQDSSMLRALAHADVLIVRAPGAEAISAGSPVPILRLDRLDG